MRLMKEANDIFPSDLQANLSPPTPTRNFLARRLRWLPHALEDMTSEQLVFWYEAAPQEAKAEQEYVERERNKPRGNGSSR